VSIDYMPSVRNYVPRLVLGIMFAWFVVNGLVLQIMFI
jgi:hypothetical protein